MNMEPILNGLESIEIGVAGTTDNAVNAVSFFEQKFSEVRAILTCNAGNQSAFHDLENSPDFLRGANDIKSARSTESGGLGKNVGGGRLHGVDGNPLHAGAVPAVVSQRRGAKQGHCGGTICGDNAGERIDWPLCKGERPWVSVKRNLWSPESGGDVQLTPVLLETTRPIFFTSVRRPGHESRPPTSMAASPKRADSRSRLGFFLRSSANKNNGVVIFHQPMRQHRVGRYRPLARRSVGATAGMQKNGKTVFYFFIEAGPASDPNPLWPASLSHNSNVRSRSKGTSRAASDKKSSTSCSRNVFVNVVVKSVARRWPGRVESDADGSAASPTRSAFRAPHCSIVDNGIVAFFLKTDDQLMRDKGDGPLPRTGDDDHDRESVRATSRLTPDTNQSIRALGNARRNARRAGTSSTVHADGGQLDHEQPPRRSGGAFVRFFLAEERQKPNQRDADQEIQKALRHDQRLFAATAS